MIHINHMSKQWPLSKLFHHGEKITKKEKKTTKHEESESS